MNKDGLSTIRVKTEVHRKAKDALKENNLGPIRTIITEFLTALTNDPHGVKKWLMQKNYGCQVSGNQSSISSSEKQVTGDSDISGELLDILSKVEEEING